MLPISFLSHLLCLNWGHDRIPPGGLQLILTRPDVWPQFFDLPFSFFLSLFHSFTSALLTPMEPNFPWSLVVKKDSMNKDSRWMDNVSKSAFLWRGLPLLRQDWLKNLNWDIQSQWSLSLPPKPFDVKFPLALPYVPPSWQWYICLGMKAATGWGYCESKLPKMTVTEYYPLKYDYMEFGRTFDSEKIAQGFA